MREFLKPTHTFDPEFIDLMSGALHDAWTVVAARNPHISGDQRVLMRIEMAKVILKLAEGGEFDRKTLADAAAQKVPRQDH